MKIRLQLQPVAIVLVETIGERKQLKVTVKHNGQELLLTAQIQYPKEAKYPCPALLGVSNTLPTRFFTGRGCAIVNIDVFAVTQHTQKRGTEPINKLYPELEANGSYCFWGWCVSRIIDGLQQLGPSKSKIDTKHLAISGCSWAGKCALYCGAFDERIALVIAHEPGGGGVASARARVSPLPAEAWDHILPDESILSLPSVS